MSTGFLYVEQGASITANIRVGSVVVGGTVKGNIEATEKLEMLSTGKFSAISARPSSRSQTAWYSKASAR